MLSKFLFIGLGGSGGKTLQFLHQNLELKLKSIGKEMPKGWQFLWIDVPSTPDLLDPGTGVKPLPNKFYVPLSGDGLRYNQVDQALLQNQGGDLYEEMAQWSPDPSTVTVPISDGAGQFRAIGRVVTMSKYEDIGYKIDQAMREMEGAGVDDELKNIARSLNYKIDDGEKTRYPQVVLVCSLAGGSGAGSIIDVADIVRAKVTNDENWDDNSVGLLYTPDVFHPEVDNLSIEANSLFALSEIVNGFYDSKPGTQPKSNILPQFGIEKPNSTRRGPRYPFVIGKSNGQITFDTPQDIFRNTGRLLSAWCLDPQITNRIRFDILGNWDAKGQDIQNTTGLFHAFGEQEVKPGFPLQSMGYSSVSLGREYFREYAVQRIAKKAITQLARGHWDDDVIAEKKSVNVALEEKTDAMFGYFLHNSGLDEVGTENDQIIDEIRSKNNQSNYTKTANEIVDFATDGKDQQKISDWVTDVMDGYNHFISKYENLEIQEQKERAKVWSSTFEEKFINHLISTISDAGVGAVVGLELINRLEQKLYETIEDLEREAVEYEHWSNDPRKIISEVLEELGDNAKISSDNPIWDDLRVKLQSPLFWTSEKTLRTTSIDLVKEFVDGALPGVKRSLREIIDLAELALDASKPEGREVRLWVDEDPTDALKPSKNEVVIESWQGYKTKYSELLLLAFKGRTESAIEAESLLIKEILMGGKSSIIKVSRKWIIENNEYRDRSLAPQKGQYEVNANVFSIKDRVESFIVDPEKEFGKYINEPLDEYLSERKAGSPRELSDRTDKFITALNKALSMAKPQIKVEQGINRKVHKESIKLQIESSTIPVKDSKVKERTKEALLAHFENDEAIVRNMFGTSDAKSIQFFAVFETAKDLSVFTSLWDPLMRAWKQFRGNPDQLSGMWQWRRTRELLHSIPIQQEVIDSMIAGWFSARIMEQIKIDEKGTNAKVSIFIPDRNADAPFPEPLIDAKPRPSSLLSSVMLSLPLAIGAYSTGSGDNPIDPYSRLINLGKSSTNVGKYNELNKEFRDFIEENNREEVLTRLNTFKDSYADINSVNINEYGHYNRFPTTGWELSSRIVTVLNDMIQVVSSLDQEDRDKF